MKKILINLALCLALFSCLGVDSTLTLTKSGSGNITLTYRISKHLYELGPGYQEKPDIISETAIKASIKENPQVKLLKFQKTEDTTNYITVVSLSFSSLSDLSALRMFDSMPMELKQENGTFIFRQILLPGGINDLNIGSREELKEILQDSFGEYTCRFTLNTPSPIKEYNQGTLSADKKHLSLELTLTEMIDATEAVELIVKW